MGVLVCLHAHPDDEAISTGGTMARASAEGHRVVLVVATDGAHGEVPDDLAPGETLVDRRRAETDRSAVELGIHRVAWLGYADSGMTGWDQNGAPGSFHGADVDEAARRLLTVLEEETDGSELVLTCYDWHGTYGHPDHVQVHRVGTRAAALAREAGLAVRLLEATSNRDEMVRMMQAARDAGFGDVDPDPDGDGFDPTAGADDGNPFGEPEDVLTLCVDVSDRLAQKRAAIAAHASQVADSSFFLTMPDEVFAMAFGREWFIEDDRTPPHRTGWVFGDAAG